MIFISITIPSHQWQIPLLAIKSSHKNIHDLLQKQLQLIRKCHTCTVPTAVNDTMYVLFIYRLLLTHTFYVMKTFPLFNESNYTIPFVCNIYTHLKESRQLWREITILKKTFATHCWWVHAFFLTKSPQTSIRRAWNIFHSGLPFVMTAIVVSCVAA